MTTNWKVTLEYGKEKININNGTDLKPMLDFALPENSAVPNIATGTMSGKFPKSTLLGYSAAPMNYTLPLQVKGSSDGDVKKKIARIERFLFRAVNARRSTKLMLAVDTNTDTPEPSWGDYGSSKYYHVLFGKVSKMEKGYYRGDARSRRATIEIELKLAPWSSGARMQLAHATGGIIEDALGWEDGESRGLIIPEATVNQFPNPILGNSTYDSGLTFQANLTHSENTDPEYILFGKSSLKVYSSSSTTDNAFYDSFDLDATSWTISCYVKLPDGGTVTASMIDVVYDGQNTATVVSAGDNGWYRAYATVTGTGSSIAVGFAPSAGYTLYIDMLQCENKGYPTPPAHGNMMGCTWTTAHNSATTRTVGRVRIPTANHMSAAEGSIALTWKAPVANTALSASLRLFEEDAGEIRLNWLQATNQWQLDDGTNQATSGVTTFAAGDIINLHAAWGPSGLFLYKNGAQIATNATYTPPTLGAYVYIGSTDAVSLHANGTFQDFRIYKKSPTATQALADGTNVAQITANNNRVGHIPWVWGKDGEIKIYNLNDASGTSTGSPHQNHVIAGGIPGTAPAVTMIRGSGEQYLDEGDVFISNFVIGEYQDHISVLYKDLVGTSNVSFSGGAYQDVAVTSTLTVLDGQSIPSSLYERDFQRNGFFFALACTDLAGVADISIRPKLYHTSGATIPPVVGNWVSIAPHASQKGIFLTEEMVFPPLPSTSEYFDATTAWKWAMEIKRTGTGTVRCDHMFLLHSEMLWLNDNSETPANINAFFIAEGFAYSGYNADIENTVVCVPDYAGVTLRLVPDRINYLSGFNAHNGPPTVAPALGDYLFLQKIWVVPRYGIF